MIIIAILLRDYSLQLTEAKEISCDVDRSKHPLCVRANRGDVVLTKSHQVVDEVKQSIALPASRAPMQCLPEEPRSSTNLNSFFNRVRTAIPFCDTNTATKLLCTGLIMGVALALRNLAL